MITLDLYTSYALGSVTSHVYNYLFSISGIQFAVSKWLSSYDILLRHGSLQSKMIHASVFAEMYPRINMFLEPQT